MVLLFAFLLVIFSPGLISGNLLAENKIDMINSGQQAIMNGLWGDAYTIFDRYCQIYADDPAGYLFLAAVYQSEMIDCEEDIFGKRFILLCDSTRLAAESYLKNCDTRDSALCYLYIGHQYAYQSLYESRFGSSLSAISMGLKAKGKYQEGLKIDSTLYDLYLGLGSYHYWKSVKSGILRWAGIFKDEKQLGISEIELAADSSLFSKEASRSALIWIMINEKQYDSAITLAESFLEKYPHGNSFLWPLAQAYYSSERNRQAAEIYGKLIERLKNRPGNYYNLIEAMYWFKMACDEIGEYDRAAEEILYLNSEYKNIPKKIRRQQRSRLGRLLGKRYR